MTGMESYSKASIFLVFFKTTVRPLLVFKANFKNYHNLPENDFRFRISNYERNFLASVVLKGIKNPLRGFIWMKNSFQINLTMNFHNRHHTNAYWWIFRVQRQLQHVFRDFNATCIDLKIGNNCMRMTGYIAIYKVSFSITLFFITMVWVKLNLGDFSFFLSYLVKSFWCQDKIMQIWHKILL